ncbi:unnamed protein product [Amoebophrya sp. A25]|nr:unnamed protein product [Amoebophrya sp. A25]|eukprot:GSA25T00016994001.1
MKVASLLLVPLVYYGPALCGHGLPIAPPFQHRSFLSSHVPTKQEHIRDQISSSIAAALDAEELYTKWLTSDDGKQQAKDQKSDDPAPPEWLLSTMAQKRKLMKRERISSTRGRKELRERTVTAKGNHPHEKNSIIKNGAPYEEVSRFTKPNAPACVGVERFDEQQKEDSNEPALHICPMSPKKNSACTVLSFGIAYDFTIDKHFLSKGCHVWSFDPSMRKTAGDYSLGSNHKFSYIGIGSSDGRHMGASTLYGGATSYPVKSLPTIMRELGLEFVDVVRLDTEGAEYEVFPEWRRDGIPGRIGQLLVEIHWMNRQPLAMFRAAEAMRCDFAENAKAENAKKDTCFEKVPFTERNRHDPTGGVWEFTMIH